MKIAINCSNLKAGGGLQVADSICSQLNRFPHHRFCVVLSSYLQSTKDKIIDFKNVDIFTYDISNTLSTILLGRDQFLDNLVMSNEIDMVFTIFGPSRWCPKVPHLSGFAMSQLVILESPFYSRMTFTQNLKWMFWRQIRQWSFKKSAHYFWTENPYISEKLKVLFKNREVFTVTNYYNQVFDAPNAWRKNIVLPNFKGTTCLSISTYYPFKNFEILKDVVRFLKERHPDFQVRFVLTFDKEMMSVPTEIRDSFVFIGRIDVEECPSLYEQSDIMFMPTLLECFTATYPEAMRMRKPIVTTDLEFARGLCGDAACYYSAVDAEAAAEAIFKVATDKEFAQRLIDNGVEQLKHFDNYEQRADKLICILEEIKQ